MISYAHHTTVSSLVFLSASAKFATSSKRTVTLLLLVRADLTAVTSACPLTPSQCQQLLVAQSPGVQDSITCLEPSDKYGDGSIRATTVCCDEVVGFACRCTETVQTAFSPQASVFLVAPQHFLRQREVQGSSSSRFYTVIAAEGEHCGYERACVCVSQRACSQLVSGSCRHLAACTPNDNTVHD